MKNYFIENGGLTTQNIFRNATSESEILDVKQQLSKKTFKSCKSIETIATLLKTWFRELPFLLLSSIPPEELTNFVDSELLKQTILDLEEPNRSIAIWLFRFLFELTKYEKDTKLNAKALAQIFSPNLYSTDNLDPIVAMAISTKLFTVITQLIESNPFEN